MVAENCPVAGYERPGAEIYPQLITGFAQVYWLVRSEFAAYAAGTRATRFTISAFEKSDVFCART
jgi:hypothetical protein